MRYTFRQLEVFLATAKFQNITRAAQSLSLSQSAASDALSTLERQFDIQLFDRVGKRLQLNGLGRELRSKALALIDSAKALEADFEGRAQMGVLNVGATLSIGNYLAVNIMTDYMNRYQGAKVSLFVANTQEIVQKLLNFEIDIGLVEGEVNESELDVWPWCDDELSVFASPDHPYAKLDKLVDDDLIAAPWILREKGSGTRQSFDTAMHRLLNQYQILLELQHTEAIKRAVESGLGIGCLSRITLQDAFDRKSLVPLAVPHCDFRRKFYFVIHKEKYRSAGIQRWVEICDSRFRDDAGCS